MAISNKNQALSNLTSTITSDSDDKLQPTVSIPVKASNLQNYFQSLLDWIFKPNTNSTDLRGKVLGVKRIPLTPVTDYSNLEFITVMPLGGICMYPMDGVNKNVGGGKIRATLGTGIIPSGVVELDGFLFLDGTSIDTSVSGNEIFKDLKALLDGYYGNSNSNNLLVLPDMRNRSVLGYNASTPITPSDWSSISPTNTATVTNYGKCGNIGGAQGVPLNINQLPNHNHAAGSLKAIAGSENNHEHYTSNGGSAKGGTGAGSGMGTTFPDPNPAFRTRLDVVGLQGQHTHTITGNTSNTGSNLPHENRPPFMVLNYIIKY
jgi:microcystin-dependent protein